MDILSLIGPVLRFISPPDCWGLWYLESCNTMNNLNPAHTFLFCLPFSKRSRCLLFFKMFATNRQQCTLRANMRWAMKWAELHSHLVSHRDWEPNCSKLKFERPTLSQTPEILLGVFTSQWWGSSAKIYSRSTFYEETGWLGTWFILSLTSTKWCCRNSRRFNPLVKSATVAGGKVGRGRGWGVTGKTGATFWTSTQPLSLQYKQRKRWGSPPQAGHVLVFGVFAFSATWRLKAATALRYFLWAWSLAAMVSFTCLSRLFISSWKFLSEMEVTHTTSRFFAPSGFKTHSTIDPTPTG